MFSKLGKVLGAASLTVALVGGASSFAYAGLFDSYLTAGATNFFEDQDREAYFDVNNSGVFDAGDVIAGFIQIESRSQPTTIPDSTMQGTLYAVFSQQVASVVNVGFQDLVTFVPTTAPTLTLSALTGGDAEANAFVALYTIPGGSTDLTTTSFPNLAAYLAYISGGTLEMTFGFDGADDYFRALTTVPGPLTSNEILTAPTSQNVASFAAVLTSLTNNTSFDFLANQCQAFAGAFGCGELSLVNGTAGGAVGVDPTTFMDGSTFGVTQCDSNTTTGGIQNAPCGFVTNADFTLSPVAIVPEPASMILFGLGLAGLGVYGRRNRNNKKSK